MILKLSAMRRRYRMCVYIASEPTREIKCLIKVEDCQTKKIKQTKIVCLVKFWVKSIFVFLLTTVNFEHTTITYHINSCAPTLYLFVSFSTIYQKCYASVQCIFWWAWWLKVVKQRRKCARKDFIWNIYVCKFRMCWLKVV